MSQCFQSEEPLLSENSPSTMNGTVRGGSEVISGRLADNASCCNFSEDVVTDESPWNLCVAASQTFAKALRLGRLRGVIGISGHGDRERFGEPVSASLLRELLQRDILVISKWSGQGEFLEEGDDEEVGDGVAEFCNNLGIAPVLHIGDGEYLARFRQFCGLLAKHAGVEPTDIPVALVVQEQELDTSASMSLYDIAGGLVADPQTDSVTAADLIDEYIHGKRLDMSWCDRFHCSLFS